MKHLLRAFAFGLVLGCPAALAQQAPQEWDGLVRVPSTHFDLVYLAPETNFAVYTKVMLDPSEAAFRRNWLRDHNARATSLGNRITNDQATRMLDRARTGLHEALTAAYTAAGYEVVSAPGPDVLRLRTAIANITVTAPDQSIGRSSSFSYNAGGGTFVLEARDSLSGALLGRGVHSSIADDRAFAMRRTRGSNIADFTNMFQSWAQMSVNGFAALRAAPPVAAAPAGD